jgi:hypothetical protein
MPTRIFAISIDSLVADHSGTSLGAGADDHLPVGRGSGSTYSLRSLLKFTLDWTDVTTITSATIHLRSNNYHAAISSPNFYIKRCTSTWSEGTRGADEVWYGDNAVEWSNQPSTTSTDHVNTTAGSADETWYSIDITNIVKQWAPTSIPGGSNQSNYGVMLKQKSGNTSSVDEVGGAGITGFYTRESAYDPYITLTYTDNTAPDAPTSMSPSGNPIITGADLTPTLSFTYTDPDSDNSASKEVEVATDSGFASMVWDSGKVGSVVASGATMNTDVGTNLTRGVRYYWRARVWDSSDAVSAWSATSSFTVNSLPTATLLAPNEANSRLAKMVMTPGSGWASPRMEVAWTYFDAQGTTQVKYELEIATSTTPTLAGGSPSTTIVDGEVTSASADVIEAPSSSYVEGNFYFVRVRVWDGTEWGSFNGWFECRVRWGLSTHRQDMTAAPTSWSVTLLDTTVVATNDVEMEYNSSTDGSTLPDAWKSSLTSVTKRQWVHYRVWFTAWGVSPATRATLNAITIQKSSYNPQPQWWLPDPLSSVGASIDTTLYAHGNQSLRIDGNATARKVTVQVKVEPGYDYMLQARMASIGNSGATVALADTQAGSSIVLLPALTADTAFGNPTILATPWNSGSRTAVWLQCTVTGAAGTSGFFDAVGLTRGTVAGPWAPMMLGSNPALPGGAPVVLDGGGIIVDASKGGLFRLKGALGAANDIVDLGDHGLRQFGWDGYLVPSGAIMLWSGETSTIPSGWVLCDGTNGTPNLTDRFIIGASTTNENTSGGTVSASAALATHATHATHTAHSAHAALAVHTHETTLADDLSAIADTVFGNGASRTSVWDNAWSAISAAHVVRQAQDASGGTPDAHSAHNAHDAHGAHAIMNFYRLAYIMKT